MTFPEITAEMGKMLLVERYFQYSSLQKSYTLSPGKVLRRWLDLAVVWVISGDRSPMLHPG